MDENFLISDFIRGDFDKSFLDIDFWERIHYDFFSSDKHIVYVYRYMDYKIEAAFEGKNKINYLLLEPMSMGIIGDIKIIDDLGVFSGMQSVDKMKFDNGFIKPYFDEDEGYLTSIYWLPLEV